MKKNIYCVLSGDKKYINQLAVTIVSVLKNLSKYYTAHFFIYTFDFSKKPKIFKKIEGMFKCEINCIDTSKYHHIFNKQNSSKFLNDWISISTYYRLLMFSTLPDYVDKAIYMDADMVIATDLAKLCKSFPNNKMLGAVAETQVIKFKKTQFKHLNDIHYFKNWVKKPYTYAYFNAGFYIANIQLCKKHNIFSSLMSFLNEYNNPKLADQDALNAIFSQKFHNYMSYLSPEYNIFCNMDYKHIMDKNYFYKKSKMLNAMDNPKIYHFAGDKKPWLTTNIFHYYEVWWEYADLLNLKITRPNTKHFDVIIAKILPHNSRRRFFVSKIYHFFRRRKK